MRGRKAQRGELMRVLVRCVVYVAVLLAPAVLAQLTEYPFQEGCCLNPTFPRPKRVSKATLPEHTLRRALNCASNNKYIGGTQKLAKAMGNAKALTIAYYYGRYMPEQGGEALTIAVYSQDGRNGMLFDFGGIGDGYAVSNLPPLLKSRIQWRVGEVNGGLWTYTRLWYLAQEIASRPRRGMPVSEILREKPKSCWVFVDDQTGWNPETGKVLGDSGRQAQPHK